MNPKEDKRIRYNQMVEGIENAKMYDGRGTYDTYVCEKCGNQMITTYKDKGVTPFTMRCGDCGGVMMHVQTKTTVEPGVRVNEWVRPTLEQFLKMPNAVQEHVLKGGLILKVMQPEEDPFFPIKKIMEKMPAKESIRIAYIPIVVCNAALHYAKLVADYCASHRMPYKLECRTIRQESVEYIQTCLKTVDKSTYEQLEQQTNEFFYSTQTDLITLYWTVRNEFLKYFPGLDDDQMEIYTNIYISHSLFSYVRDFQVTAEKHMSKVCGCTIKTDPDIHILKIWKSLCKISEGYDIGKAPIVELALKVIANRIDEHVFSEVELTED